MKIWRRVAFVVAVPLMALPFTAAAPASAATSGIDTTFVAVTATQVPCCNGGGEGPSFSLWDFQTYTLGPSPALATLTIDYCTGELCYETVSGFTLTDGSGNSLTGSANGGLNASTTLLTGSVTSATGSYAGLNGHAVTLNYLLTPNDVPVSGLFSFSGTSEFGPAVLAGTLTVAG
jgi:hypothetical protein